MISIKSYLRSPSGEFLSLSDCGAPPVDERHVEGAIEVVVDDVTVIDRSMWDDVDQLWAYIIDMIQVLEASGESHTYFPDQPIKLSLRKVGPELVLITLQAGEESRRATVDRQELIREIKREAEDFFRQLSILMPANASEYQEIVRRINY
ncbi:hypothetical protein [Gandjariella thermophila]|uniref:Uncharacterized protein n=1 Tax=Gandjariella thermophila TaxID=1931992 RepID=A0A4D4JD97_9PSEU|nr:hypothetical protein [Gandjariella thermophila]GDY32628.1 hypothetical protein GTS_42610 [Gandjariella thermophila]